MDQAKWEEFLLNVNIILFKTKLLSLLALLNLKNTHGTKSKLVLLMLLLKLSQQKFIVQNFHHAFTSKATELHKDLKSIENIMQQTKYSLLHNQSIPTTILAHI